jgi:hemoglobin
VSEPKSESSGNLLQEPAPVPEPSLFDLIGGEPGWRGLVDRFYDQMDLDERFTGIRKLHPNTLEGSRDKLYWFLCGWSGGPNHYVERFGHPRLRARHMPFPIGSSERDQWLLCMAEAMQEQGLAPLLFDRLIESFQGTADWMRNTQG